MRVEINLIFEDKVVDFVPMRGRHMGEREIWSTFQYTSIRSVYAGLNSFYLPLEPKFWFSKEKDPYPTE